MKKLFSIFAALLFAGSMMANVGNLFYTLAITQNPNNTETNQENSYTGNYEVTVEEMAWNLPGNLQLGDYWAIGGKSITSAERATYSKTAMRDAIAKIVVSHSGTTSDQLKVDSVVLIVASDAAFTNVIERVKKTPTVAKNTAGTVEFEPASDQWATGAYYKISFFLTNAKNSNYRMPINKIEFFSYLDPTAPAITASDVELGICPTKTGAFSKTVQLEVAGANLTNAITYTQGTNTTVSGTLTTDGGTLTLAFAADAAGEYADHFMLQSGTTALEVTVTANVLKTDGLGTSADPFSTADVLNLNNAYGAGEKFWVLGYIVGSAGNNGVLADDAESNLALGDAADQTTGLVPVELPSGDVRTALNVVSNPTNKGKQVKVHGQLVSYFVTAGVKGTDDYEFITAVEPTYYLKNNWDGGDWSWKEMTKVDDDEYKLENVVFGGSGVNWNTAESDEGASWVALVNFTGDIIKALDTVSLRLTPSTGVINAEILGSYVAPATNTYTAAGSSAALFGTAWDPTVEANDLTLKEGTTFEIVYTDVTLPEGAITFKVCVNHSWDVAYPASNYSLTIPEGGIYTVTITYDSSTNAVSATAEKTGSAVVIPTVAIKGSWDAAGAYNASWSAGATDFTVAADELTASATIALAEAHDFEFGLEVGGNWTANGATVTRDANTTDLTSGSGNMHLTADVAGNYTFTYTYATKTLAVTFPEAPVVGCDWDNIEFFNVGIGDTDENYNQFKICKEGENPNFVNIQIAPWANNNKGIYINFPTAEIGTVSLPADQYKIEGAGMLLFLSAFSAKETDVTIQFQGTDCNFTVYNAKGEEVPTAIENNEIIEKTVKFIENGQLFIRKNGKTYNAQGAVVK